MPRKRCNRRIQPEAVEAPHPTSRDPRACGSLPSTYRRARDVRRSHAPEISRTTSPRLSSGSGMAKYHRAMRCSWLVLLVILASSTLAHAQVSRREVDEAFAKSIAGSHACGGHYRAVYDWKSYDELPWAHHDKSKEEQLGYELSNVEIIGAGLDDACDDRDCKAVLASVDTIVYRATGKESERGLDAQISGHTVTFVNDVFASTRDGTDYYHALKRGCAKA